MTAFLLFSIARHLNSISETVSSRDEQPSLMSQDTNLSLDQVIDSIIQQMSTEERIGQLLMINYFGTDMKKMSYLINDLGIGGLMLMSQNVDGYSFDTIRKNNENLIQKSHRIPLFISVDQEGGGVARIKKIIKEYPYPARLYEKEGKAGIQEQARYYSQNLKQLNFNINFSPVVDVVRNKDSIIADRSFSADAQVNADLGNMYIDIFNKDSMIAVPKHYPGYGTVSKDPHYDICKDEESTVSQLAKPFFQLQESPMIMTSHVIFTQEDSVPATLSPTILKILRDKGYSNIIISDDIQMQSVTRLYDYRLASLKSIQADCDIVLSVTKDESQWYQNAVDLHGYLVKAYKNGILSEKDVNRSLKRILKIKLKYLQQEKWSIIPDRTRTSLNIK